MALLAALIAGCGTTVQGLGAQPTSEGSQLSTRDGSDGVTTPGSVPTQGGQTASFTVSGGNRAPAGSLGGSTSVGTPSGPTTGPRVAVHGVGIDAQHVYLGFPTEKDFDTVVGTMGLDGISAGDQEGDVKAVVAYVNKHGGVLGRQLVAALHDNSSAQIMADYPAAMQASCNYYTQDRPVAAVVDITALSTYDAWACWKQNHVPFFVGGAYTDQATFDQMHPYMYAINVNRTDSYLPALLDRQEALGYFRPWDTVKGESGSAPVKVGILYEETSRVDQRVVAQLQKELKARHHEVAATFGVKTGDYSQEAAAVLRLQSAGVTHVYAFYELNALLFMRQAENQGYRPRYSAWMGTMALMPQAPPRQLHGMLGATWNPYNSVLPANNPGDVSPTAPLCRKILHDGGLNYPRFSSSEAVGFLFCDAVLLAAKAINKAGSTRPDELRKAIASLVANREFVSALAFTTVFSQSRSDENGAIRDLGFVDGCSCFRYLSRINHPS